MIIGGTCKRAVVQGKRVVVLGKRAVVLFTVPENRAYHVIMLTRFSNSLICSLICCHVVRFRRRVYARNELGG